MPFDDGATLNAQSGGDTIATHTDGGKKYQVIFAEKIASAIAAAAGADHVGEQDWSHAWGRLPSVGTTYGDSWYAGGAYNFATTTGTWEVVSSDAQDGVGGTGVREVRCYLLDASWDIQEVLVTLNGTTPVTISGGSYQRLVYARATITGTTGAAVGAVDIRANGSGTIHGRIVAGDTDTRMSIHTVPNGKVALVSGFGVIAESLTADADDLMAVLEYRLVSMATWIQAGFLKVTNAAPSAWRRFDRPLSFPERTDIRIRVKGSTEGDTPVTQWDLRTLNEPVTG